MIKNVIFDLDGTLALCPKELWDGVPPIDFAELGKRCDEYLVNEPIARLFRFYRDSPGHRVWILSGRSGSVDTERKTINWLTYHKLLPKSRTKYPGPEDFAQFHMRQHGDKRSDVEVKREMIQTLGLTPENTEIVFDDRNCMVNAWRLWGFQCCQVAEGGF
ncbi:NLI interacting factor-like phosphatase [Vibrio phage 13VV501A]|nr:NLI interacting factor-like phosphatase [Vibrio phage 13VV501A]